MTSRQNEAMDDLPPATISPWRLIEAEVRHCLELVDTAQVDRLRGRLQGLRGACFVTGQGRSGLVAQMAAMRLMQVGKVAHVVGAATTPAFGRDDLLMVFSASGETPTSLLRARQAKEVGGAVCSLTARADAPIAHLSDLAVIVPLEGTTQFTTVLFSQAALLLCDGLAMSMGIGDGGQMERHANLE